MLTSVNDCMQRKDVVYEVLSENIYLLIFVIIFYSGEYKNKPTIVLLTYFSKSVK